LELQTREKMGEDKPEADGNKISEKERNRRRKSMDCARPTYAERKVEPA